MISDKPIDYHEGFAEGFASGVRLGLASGRKTGLDEAIKICMEHINKYKSITPVVRVLEGCSDIQLRVEACLELANAFETLKEN